jgi:hypothetical protein
MIYVKKYCGQILHSIIENKQERISVATDNLSMSIHRLFPSSLAIGNSKIASVHVVERTPGAQSLPSRLNDCIRLRLARLFV